MNQRHTERQPLSTIAKIGYGILLPITVFVAYQLSLIGSQTGSGSWDGMLIFFGTLFIVPGLLVADCWVIPTRWERKASIFVAGLMIPAVIGATEFLWLYGSDRIRWAINSAKSAPSLGTWLFILLFFTPLFISIIYVVRRRSHGDKQ